MIRVFSIYLFFVFVLMPGQLFAQAKKESSFLPSITSFLMAEDEVLEMCGNGMIETGEMCDDGNIFENDSLDIDFEEFEILTSSLQTSGYHATINQIEDEKLIE